MDEFTEIGNSGQIIEFKPVEEGVYTMTVIGTSNKFVCTGFLSADIDNFNVRVPFFSDEKGFWGRTCPNCNTYFRTNQLPDFHYCPYCFAYGISSAFLTGNQKEYINIFCETFQKTKNINGEATIDFDKITNQLHLNNKSPWIYKEQIQQTDFKCSNCKTENDILGEYGICSSCGHLNFKQIIKRKIDETESRFSFVDNSIEDRHERETEWEKLLRCVSDFDGLANELKKFFLKIPQHPKRKSELSNLSFQNIINANDKINIWFGFQILEKISEDDRDFLNKMFNKRHIFTHKNGRVDEEYLKNTNDLTVKLYQTIRLRSNEIKRLIPLVRMISDNLLNGFLEIK